MEAILFSPVLLLGLMIYLITVIHKKMKAGELKPGWGYLLELICLIPAGFCAFAVVMLIGIFTGIIPLM